MRCILLILLATVSFGAYSQNVVKGIITDSEGNVLPGAKIMEVGIENSTTSDVEGRFRIRTLQDSCGIIFSWIGYDTKTITVTNDTSVLITLAYWHYESNWISLGTRVDVFSSSAGFSVSNGLDEHPITHFEDFSESWMYKLSGTTNFKKDYSYGVKLSRDYVFRYIYMPAIEYRKTAYSSIAFQHSDMNFSFGLNFRRFWGTFLVKAGYQGLNGQNSVGAGIGLQNSHRKPDFYYGFIIGHWAPYFTYNAFIQSFIYKHRWSLRADYERIEDFDFLNLGIHYIFNR